MLLLGARACTIVTSSGRLLLFVSTTNDLTHTHRHHSNHRHGYSTGLHRGIVLLHWSSLGAVSGRRFPAPASRSVPHALPRQGVPSRQPPHQRMARRQHQRRWVLNTNHIATHVLTPRLDRDC